MAVEKEEYKKLITEFIQKQMVVLGPNIALDKAKKVPGLSVSESGSVLELSGDPKMVLRAVTNEYVELSGSVAKQSLELLMQKYPDVPPL